MSGDRLRHDPASPSLSNHNQIASVDFLYLLISEMSCELFDDV